MSKSWVPTLDEIAEMAAERFDHMQTTLRETGRYQRELIVRGPDGNTIFEIIITDQTEY